MRLGQSTCVPRRPSSPALAAFVLSSSSSVVLLLCKWSMMGLANNNLHGHRCKTKRAVPADPPQCLPFCTASSRPLSLCVTYLLLAGRSPKEILLPFLYLNWYTGLALFLVENPFSGRPYHRIIISKDCGIVCFIDPFLFVPSNLFKRYTYLKSWWDKLTLTVGACLQKWRRSECVSQQQCLV